jgi:hypothetical protein
MLEIVLELVRAHRPNSEKMTVFIGMLYQHYAVQEKYAEIAGLNQNFKAGDTTGYLALIEDMFRRGMKNAIYVAQDRISKAVIEFDSPEQDLISGKSLIEEDRWPPGHSYDKNRLRRPGQAILGIDSESALQIIERSELKNKVALFLDLLEPIRFQSESKENIRRQTMYLNILAMFCRDRHGNPVYPYQM